MTTPTSETEVTNTAQPKMGDVQFDELFEDILGLSGRSIRAIKSLFSKPVEYFEAAKHPYWQNAFSPSFRIFLGLMALITALKFFYAAEDGVMYKYLEQTINESLLNRQSELAINPSTVDVKAVVEKSIQYMSLFYTPLVILFYLLIAILFQSFGEKLNFVVRARYVFAILIPATLVSLLSTIIMIFLPVSFLPLLSFTSLALTFGLIFWAAYRGAFSKIKTKKGRAGRALGLTTLLSVASIFASTISVGVGAYKAGYEQGEAAYKAQKALKQSPPEKADLTNPQEPLTDSGNSEPSIAAVEDLKPKNTDSKTSSPDPKL